MAQFSLKVWAANHAVAEVTSYGRDDKHVSIEIPDETVWDAEGLRKLAATLQGAAGIMEVCSAVEA